MNEFNRKSKTAFYIIMFVTLIVFGLCMISSGYPIFILTMLVFYCFSVIFALIIDIFIYSKNLDIVFKKQVQLFLPFSIGLYTILKTFIAYFPDSLISMIWFFCISLVTLFLSYLPIRYLIMKNRIIIYFIILKYLINLGLVIYVISYFSGMTVV